MSFRHAKFNNGIPTTYHLAGNYAPASIHQPSHDQKGLLDQLSTKLGQYEKRVEKVLDNSALAQVKPYIPQIGRFLIVSTFFEDSLRILSQWFDQVYYLWNYRHIPYYLVLLLLFSIVVTMLGASTLIVLKKHQLYASVSLILVIIVQGLMYGLFSGSNFVLRNFSLIGGLLIAFSDTLAKTKRAYAGLPDISSNSSYKNYVLLAGRILLVLLFFTFAITKSWLTTAIISIGIFSIALGYKTRFASVLLITILTFYNFTSNAYWFGDHSDSKRDYLKYEFFQTLSIVGGLLLVVNTGAGELSIDEKKKVY